MKTRKPRKPKTLREKVENEFPEFASEVVGLSVQQLDKRIADMQKELEDSEQHKESNDALKQAKGEYDTLRKPYSDVKKAVNVKTRYVVSLIREKGGA